MDLAAELLAGARRFDAGRWWDAHEAWEESWRARRGPERAYLQGLIQIAAANVQIERGRPLVARGLLDRACARLLEGEPARWPLDTGFLLCACAALAARIEAGKPARPLRLRLAALIAWSALS